jgi:hypothetical protein
MDVERIYDLPHSSHDQQRSIRGVEGDHRGGRATQRRATVAPRLTCHLRVPPPWRFLAERLVVIGQRP